RTYELIYQNRFGQTVWRELRGLDAGHDYPQLSIHRGKLQGVLYEAVRERLGDACVHCGHELVDFADDGRGVTAGFALRDGGRLERRGGLLIGADGIHSAVRARLCPEEGLPRRNGM